MNNPYGMGNSYVPQYQQQQNGGYSQSAVGNPFQTPQGPAMGGPPPAAQMSQQAPGRGFDQSLGGQGAQNSAANPFGAQSGFANAPTGYQMQAGMTTQETPWLFGSPTQSGGPFFSQNSTNWTNMFNNSPVPTYMNGQAGAAGQASGATVANPNYIGLMQMGANGPQGFSQSIPTGNPAGSSWEQYQQQFGNYMNNLNSWNSNGGPTQPGANFVNNLAASDPSFWGGAAAQLNYSGLYGGAQNAYNNTYNQFQQQGQFGIAPVGGQQTVGGR